MNDNAHWEAVYNSKALESVSWYSHHLSASVAMIQRLAPPPSRIIDVGAGGSTLVDDLLSLSYSELTAVDLSATALAAVKRRLSPNRSASVTFVAGDICAIPLPTHYFDLWHDRAVFHFFTSPVQRSAYIAQSVRILKPKAHVILSLFGPQGPTRCSGLDVVRYDVQTLAAQFAPHFELIESSLSTHCTPGAANQQFLTCVLQKVCN